MWDLILEFLNSTGIVNFFEGDGWMNLIMILIGAVLLFLAIKKKYEPYLLIPIAIGMILVNILPSIYVPQDENGLFLLKDPVTEKTIIDGRGLLGYLHLGVEFEIYPCLIFVGIGATTDFGPLIANKKTMILGAAAQIGIFAAFLGAIALSGIWPEVFNFTVGDAAGIGIIGGADGPTAILVSNKLASSDLTAGIALAAYSYMALVPVIFPPIIKLCTTKKERSIKMETLREVTKTEKILFPIIVTLVCCIIVPSCAPLLGCLMFGNLIKESGVVPNLVHTASNALLYICTILLGLSVGATAIGTTFLQPKTIMIFVLGILAFIIAAICGLLGGKLMCLVTKGKVNPMIGAAGVSAVPMAARVVHKIGQEEDPDNYLLMHAMGPNVSGVIGSAIAAGILLSMIG
ncbi:MAG: sodium ion-translocating decarboxylase subunit beta [Bacilli bacterium]|nr:sodium ion-translocating decarboxylase subunit beta [Bacilli bacterium]